MIWGELTQVKDKIQLTPSNEQTATLSTKRLLVISGLNVWSMGEKQGAQSLYETLKGYARWGWDVHFLTAAPGQEGLLDKTITVHRFWSPGITNSGSTGIFPRVISILIGNFLPFIFLGIFKGLRLARQTNFDLYYGYTMHGVPVASILGRSKKKPVVTRFQGTKTYPQMHSLWGRIRVRNHLIAMKMPTDLLIMANDGTRGDEVARMLGIPQDKFCFWVNGLVLPKNLTNFDPADFKSSLGIQSTTRLVLSASRLVHWKRVDRLIQAIPGIVSRARDVLFVILGDGPERTRLEAMAKELGVEDVVHFEGAVRQERVVEYMKACDVFVSLYDLSNVGNPLLEAMACGCCVVTLNVGDTAEFIRDHENGILLELSDLANFPGVLVELLDSEDLRQSLGTGAATFAKNNFWSWDKRMDTEVSLVESIMADHTRGLKQEEAIG